LIPTLAALFNLGFTDDDCPQKEDEQLMNADSIPEGYGAITPYLLVDEVSNLLEFLKEAFGAVEITRGYRTDGSIRHAEVRINGSPVMLGEPTAGFGPMPAAIYLYVTDCDTVYQQAIHAGGESIMPPTNMPSGERYGGVKDPSGNVWWVATHVEDVPPDEQIRRWQAFEKKDD
jgi:uncharacterized glyoxalase superfamily protein PhnB